MRNFKLKCLSLILSAFIVFSIFPPFIANADIIQSGSCGANLTWTVDDEGVLIISGNGPMDNWTENDPAPWFDYNLSSVPISTVVFNGNITSIGDYAFLGFNKLYEITIPDSVTYIGTGAFTRAAFSELSIPDSVTTIGEGAFARTGLVSITIPDNIESISDYAFYCCRRLISITIPNSVTSIGNNAFGYCKKTDLREF